MCIEKKIDIKGLKKKDEYLKKYNLSFKYLKKNWIYNCRFKTP